MKVTVNGEPREVPDGSSALDLVLSIGYDRSRVAVEVDGDICPRAELADMSLREGMRIEIVGFVGGG